MEHRTLPVTAVQFHPESLLTLGGGLGLKLVEAALSACSDRGKIVAYQ